MSCISGVCVCEYYIILYYLFCVFMYKCTLLCQCVNVILSCVSVHMHHIMHGTMLIVTLCGTYAVCNMMTVTVMSKDNNIILVCNCFYN